MLCGICNGNLHIPLDLTKTIQSSFSPEPITVVLDAVVDTKGWMQDVTPALHDHLKAHQFRFKRDESGECKMYYKEWSTDSFWLPPAGLSLLPLGIDISNTSLTYNATCLFL